MDLDRWVKVFDKLLPRSRAWGLVIDRTLRKFFHGLAILPKTIHEHFQSLLLEAFPLSTSRLVDWSKQFGSPVTMTDVELDAEWGAFGGQSPHYIQNYLRSAGFDVYVHEWWVPGSNPVEARNPIPLVPISYVLVNDLYHGERDYLYQFQSSGNDAQFVGDESVSFGAYDGQLLIGKQYPCPDIPSEYPVYWYVCGEEWLPGEPYPDRAIVPESRVRTLIRMIYKVKPVHTRVILYIDPEPDTEFDIQDTYTSDTWLQDGTSFPDDLQDKF
jgi:hypothetical protein